MLVGKKKKSTVVHIKTEENESDFTLHIGDNHSQVELHPSLVQCVEGLVHVFLEVQVYVCQLDVGVHSSILDL